MDALKFLALHARLAASSEASFLASRMSQELGILKNDLLEIHAANPVRDALGWIGMQMAPSPLIKGERH